MMGSVGIGMVWWMWLLMGLGVVGFWAIVILIVRAVTRSPSAPDPPSPVAVLNLRLANGEIDVDEYELIRRTLATGH